MSIAYSKILMKGGLNEEYLNNAHCLLSEAEEALDDKIN
jgi:hypothetical protein